LGAVKNVVAELTGNRVLNAAIIAWFFAQTLKIVTFLLFQKKLDFKRFFNAGGMPSSHTASTVAACVQISMMYGTSSVEFALSVIFTVIVMYDAQGVRRQAGEHARILNVIIDTWEEDNGKLLDKDLKELLGHTPLEVFGGIVLGILVGIVY
jgi:acid phosphatase family membrane protein YuiD